MATRCSVNGCPFTARTRGFCPKHYQRWRKFGDPTVCWRVDAAEAHKPRVTHFTPDLWRRWWADRFEHPHRERLATGIQLFRSALAHREPGDS